MTEMFLAQLQEPFRIGLLVALVWTMFRTRAQTGTVIPLLAGIVFVAVILPTTMGTTLGTAGDLVTVIGVGLAANAVLVAVILGLWTLVSRALQR